MSESPVLTELTSTADGGSELSTFNDGDPVTAPTFFIVRSHLPSPSSSTVSPPAL